MTKPIFLRPISAQAPKPKNITIKLPPELAADLENLQAESEAAGFKFDIYLVCAAALEAAAKLVRKELKKSQSQGDQK